MWVPTGIAFLVAGVLELTFLGLSVLGTLMGAGMTGVALFGGMRGDEAFLGPMLLVFYGLWLFCTIVAAPVHLVAGVAFVTGRRNRTLLIAATVVSLLPLATVYCAPFALVAGVLGLVTLLAPPTGASDHLAASDSTLRPPA